MSRFPFGMRRAYLSYLRKCAEQRIQAAPFFVWAMMCAGLSHALTEGGLSDSPTRRLSVARTCAAHRAIHMVKHG